MKGYLYMMKINVSELPVMKSCCKTCPFKQNDKEFWQDFELANKVIDRTLFKGHQICHGTTFISYLCLMKKYYLYQHKRKDNGQIFYIGIGQKYRPYAKKDRSKFWKSIVLKYGYDVDILLETFDYEFLKSEEIRLIKLYGRIDLGTGQLCNLTDGGEGMLNCNFSEEHRKKLRESNVFKKKIIEIETGKEFDSIKSAADSQGIKANTLQYQLLRNRSKKFRYSNKESLPAENKKDRIVFDFRTNKIYNSIKEAAVDLGINYNTLRFKLSKEKNDNCPVKYIEVINNRCKGAFDHNYEIYKRLNLEKLVK